MFVQNIGQFALVRMAILCSGFPSLIYSKVMKVDDPSIQNNECVASLYPHPLDINM